MDRIGRLLRVQPGEGRTAALTFALLATTASGLTIGESGVTALFLDHAGPDALPAMYLGQGAAGLVAMLVLTGWLARVDRRRAYVGMPLLLAAIVLLERLALATDAGWIYPLLWITVTLDYLIQAVFLWGTAGLVTDTRSAKRLFPLFAAGSILGAVAGGLATRVLADAIGTENLLLVWVGSLVAGAGLCASVIGVRRGRRRRPGFRRRREPPWADVGRGLAHVRRSPLLVWLTVAGVLFSVLFFSLYLPFAQAATDRFRDPAELAGFLGLVWAAVTAIAFLVSVFGSNRLLGWLGATAMIVILPVLYAGSFGLLLVSSSLAMLVAVRFVVNVWLQAVTSPAWETLVNVVPESRRDQVRAFLNGGPTQVGTAIAGVVALVGDRVLTARQLTILGLVVAVVTIAVTWRIRRSYAGALVEALRAGRPRVFDPAPVEGLLAQPDLDAETTASALRTSIDQDAPSRRLATDLLANARLDDDRVREALIRLARDPDGVVRASAVGALGRAPGEHGAALEDALADPEPAVRIASIEALGRTGASTDRVRGALDDPVPAVAATAAVALLETPARPDAQARLEALLRDPAPDVRLDAVRRLPHAAPDDAAALLDDASRDEATAVRIAALRALAIATPLAALAPALDALADADPAVRDAALEVLAAAPPNDVSASLRARATSEAEAALADHGLASTIPDDGDAHALLRQALLQRARSRGLVAVSTLALLHGDRDGARTALRHLSSNDPAQRATALETLEAGADRTSVRPLLVLWEDGAPHRPGGAAWVAAVADDPDPLIRACLDLVRRTDEAGGPMANVRASMSPMERVLVLRRIPLFAELSPADLQRVAEIAEERAYADGEAIAVEGETGEELHIVLEGEVDVLQGRAGEATSLARRGPNEVVGEMSIISRAPRMASLVADGDVRTLRIGNREFESMLRDRPDVSLAVMRVLADRLRAAADAS